MRLYGSPRRIFLTSHTGANTQQLSGKGLTDWQVWNFKIDLFNICACSYYEYLTMLIRLHTFTESSVGLPVIFLLRIRGGGGVTGFKCGLRLDIVGFFLVSLSTSRKMPRQYLKIASFHTLCSSPFTTFPHSVPYNLRN